MIRHIVLLTLRSDAPPDAATTIVEALRALTGVVPSIRDYQAGVDLGIVPGNATVAATATLTTTPATSSTGTIPPHRSVIEQFIDPVRESRTAIQFEI